MLMETQNNFLNGEGGGDMKKQTSHFDAVATSGATF
jgi:hypothetical protein